MRTIGTAVAVYASVLFNGLILLSSAPAAEVLVEAEAFAERGGWVVDPQFMDQMGSPYLLAHGLGKPVANAKTEVGVSRGRHLPAVGAHQGLGAVAPSRAIQGRRGRNGSRGHVRRTGRRLGVAGWRHRRDQSEDGGD